jgi:hypothetical protein
MGRGGAALPDPAGVSEHDRFGNSINPAEGVLALATAPAGLTRPPIVPVEATAALGMLRMERPGILTTNIAGPPGSHPALRLEPAGPVLTRLGGLAAVDAALDELAGLLTTPQSPPELLLGA